MPAYANRLTDEEITQITNVIVDNEAWNNEIRIMQEVLQPWMDEDGQVIAGALESSNVNAIEAMVAMIDTQRRYDLNMRVISTADETAKSGNSLLSVKG